MVLLQFRSLSHSRLLNKGLASPRFESTLTSLPSPFFSQFTFNPDWFKDEDGEDNGEDEVDLDQYERHSENGEPEANEGNYGDDDDEAEMEEQEAGAQEGEVQEKLKDLTLSGQADGEEDGGKMKDVVEG